MSSDDPQAEWQPSSNFNTGREGHAVVGIVDHITQGTDSLSWLRGAAAGSDNNASSAHYLVARNGHIYQLVREVDTAWGAGNWNYNLTRINIEHEGFSGQPLTNAQIQASGALHGRIAQRHNLGSLDRTEDIGHYQVPDPNNPKFGGGIDHHTSCPGNAFPWDQILAIANSHAPIATPAPTPVALPEQEFFSQTHHYISHGFLRFWHENGGLSIFGLPISEEFTNAAGITVQWFERSRFEYQPKIANNKWGVVLGLVGSEDAASDKAAFPAAFAPRKE